MYHSPVLLSESIESLITNQSGIYVDVTYGGGGHSCEILKKITNGRLLAFDQDADSEVNKIEDERFELISQNFKYLRKFLQYYKAWPVDGILADLGVSSHQFDQPERGFSTRFDGPLDMRMNRQKELSAKQIINQYSEGQLRNIFFSYGELPNANKVAFQIVKARSEKEISTTAELVEIVKPLFPFGKENKYLAMLFQAIRIEVNSELEVLREFLTQTVDALKTGGRLVIISYHSLEDRLVKKFMKSGNFEGIVEKDFFGNPNVPFNLISRKAIVPSNEEISQNPRARSAKLRIAEKK